MAQTPRPYIEVGFVRKAHGLTGLLQVQLHDATSTALHTVPRLFVGPVRHGVRAAQAAQAPLPPLAPRALQGVQDLGAGAYLVDLAGVSDRDQAEALRGAPLYAHRDDLALPDDELFVADLIGCAVQLPDGTAVGTIGEVPVMGGRDMLVIHREGRDSALVPLVPELVPEVDLEARRVVIDPPEGLLDLDREG